MEGYEDIGTGLFFFAVIIVFKIVDMIFSDKEPDHNFWMRDCKKKDD